VAELEAAAVRRTLDEHDRFLATETAPYVLRRPNVVPYRASVSDSTVWTMVLGAAEGQPSAREEFARRYSQATRAYLCARWGSSPLHSELDDATQEVFVECFKKNGALARVDPERPGGFRSFLYGIIRNVARRFEERWTKKRPESIGELPLESAEEPASRAFDRAWARGIMKQATELQGERARAGGSKLQRRVELLQLRFTEGMPIREIAALWTMEPTQVQYEYKCARDEFQAALADVVREHDPDGDAASESARLLGLLAN
jgi:RNA polymerase sigma factor (sigma-70 family)